MILFIDYEHELGYQQPWGEKLQAARTRIKYRLEDITGDHCLLVRYPDVTPELISNYNIRAVFISGSSTDHIYYAPEKLTGLRIILREFDLPIFGFCGGFQLIGATYGAPLELIGPLAPNEKDPCPDSWSPGMKKEFGYQPVQVLNDHPLFNGLSDEPVMRQAHAWELKEIPEDFELLASSNVTPIQMLVHKKRPLVGTQFHPEYYTDQYPAGRALIKNFCQMAQII